MTLQTNDPSSQLILRRIDAIIAELQTLRQQVLTIQAPEVAAANLVLRTSRFVEPGKLG